jgi:hypothetical protein
MYSIYIHACSSKKQSTTEYTYTSAFFASLNLVSLYKAISVNILYGCIEYSCIVQYIYIVIMPRSSKTTLQVYFGIERLRVYSLALLASL